MKSLLVLLAALLCVSAIGADSPPRYECKNGKCTLLPRPRLTAAPTPAAPETKPAAVKTETIATVDCNEAQAEHVVKAPLRSVLVKTANRSACLSRGILRRVFSRCR